MLAEKSMAVKGRFNIFLGVKYQDPD